MNSTTNPALIAALKTAVEAALASKHTRGLTGATLASAVAELVGYVDPAYCGSSYDEDTQQFLAVGGAVILTLDLNTRSIR